MAQAILVRHAQSHPSVAIPDSKWPLSEKGRWQAGKLIPVLSEMEIDLIYSSPYLRCLETIGPFAHAVSMDVIIYDDLRERNLANGVTDDFYEIYKKSWFDFNYSLPGCETALDCQKRFIKAVKTICKNHTGKTIAISSHGNAISLLLNHIDPTFHYNESLNMRNPDLFRVKLVGEELIWDRDFTLPDAFNEISTNHDETPITWE